MSEETLLEKAKRIGVDAYTVEDFVNGMEQRDKLLEALKSHASVLADSVETHGTHGGWLDEEAKALRSVIAEVEEGKCTESN